MDDEDCLLVWLLKGDELWVIKYKPSRCAEALKQVGQWSKNQELAFDWVDAVAMFLRIRQVEAIYDHFTF